MKAPRFVGFLLFLAGVSPLSAAVSISSPSNNASVGTSAHVVASATTSTCSKGVAAVGVYVDNALTFVNNGPQVDTNVSLNSGNHTIVVQAWDYCGGSTSGSSKVTTSTKNEVAVATPADGTTVTTNVPYVASSTSTCGSGVAAMGVYVDDQLAYSTAGSSLNTMIALGGGKHKTVVQSWDQCGGVTKTPIAVSVGGTTISNVQAAPGWNQWGQLPPVYDICDAPCPGVTWSMAQNQSAISLSGNATQFNLGGTTPYSDVLFSNPIIGQGNKQGLTDANHKLLPQLHDFTYEADVYITNLAVTQVLEFDINMYAGGFGMEWGTECNHLNGNVWDYWDNVNAQWIHTAIPCTMKNGWNHVVIAAHRGDNNEVTYQSVAMNGTTYPMNITVPAKTVPKGWWGMTVNYQMDGNYKMDAYTTYVDNFKFTYL